MLSPDYYSMQLEAECTASNATQNGRNGQHYYCTHSSGRPTCTQISTRCLEKHAAEIFSKMISFLYCRQWEYMGTFSWIYETHSKVQNNENLFIFISCYRSYGFHPKVFPIKQSLELGYKLLEVKISSCMATGECSNYRSLQADSKAKCAASPTSWRPPGFHSEDPK